MQLNDIKTGEPAVLVHAAVWKWGSDMDTGNFVPEDETVDGITGNRLCVYTHYLLTMADIVAN